MKRLLLITAMVALVPAIACAQTGPFNTSPYYTSSQPFNCAITNTLFTQCYASPTGASQSPLSPLVSPRLWLGAENDSTATAPEIDCWDTAGLIPVGNKIVINPLGIGQIITEAYPGFPLVSGLLCQAQGAPTGVGTIFVHVR